MFHALQRAVVPQEGDAAADEAPSVMSTDGMDDAAQTPTPPPPPPPTADDAPHDGAAATAADTPAATDASTCMSTGGIAVAEVREAPIATSSSADVSKFAERAKFIPMRLTLKERRLFRLLEAALSVNEYTDKVDILSWRNKSQRVVQQIKDICSILSGLAIAQVGAHVPLLSAALVMFRSPRVQLCSLTCECNLV
jgi:Protein of unknown function (DUF2009)